MPFCANCGQQYDEGVKFCPGCGAVTAAAQPQQQAYQAPNQQQSYQQQPNYQPPYQAQPQSDVENNKVMGVLAYLSWLVLIPLFAAKDSPFARYHTNQGIVLAIVEVAWWIIIGILSAIATATYAVGLLIIISIISWLVNIGFLVFSILGIVNACKGEMKPLPLIGGIKILK